MSNIPVLKSKLIMPELSRSFLLANRLNNLYKNMDSCRAVAIYAPAGYGKTTLTVSYFSRPQTVSSRVCWYRLDQEDKNLLSFMTYLIEAIFPSDVSEFAEFRKTLESREDADITPQDAILMICREMWLQYGLSIQNRTYIVFDDFQNAAQNEDICGMVRFMVDNLPPSCTIFILSRAKPDVFTEKQKLEKRILELGADNLAFNESEIESLLSMMGQTQRNGKLAGMIAKSTEGWIAGVVILCQAYKNKGLDAEAFESGMLGHEEALFQYLSLEVLKSVGEKTQNALARLALLQDFTEAEAAEILEIHNVKALMGQCMAFGMFIQRIPGNPVVYRFHSLFREFLLYTLRDGIPAEEIVGIHLRAAGYYMKHETYGRAAEHLAKCGNSESAMDMVTKAGFNKFMIGETGQLKMWLDTIPEEMIRDNPVLLLFKAQLMPNSRQPEMVDTLKEVLRLSLKKNNFVTYYDAASVLVYILMCSNNMIGLVEMTEGLPKELNNVSPQLGNTMVILDMVRSIGEEQFSDAEAQSESIVYNLLPEDSKWLYLILSCIVYYCSGKLENAENCMRTALILESFKNIEPSRGFILLFLSMVLMLQNEREDLPSHIAEVLDIGKKYDYEYLSAHGKRLAAFERYLSFDTEAACEMLEQAALLFLRINNRAMAAACRLLRKLWSMQYNGPLPDLDEARRELEIIRKACPGMMVYESSLSVFGAIASEAGDYKLAEDILLAAVKESKSKKGYQVLCGSCFHLAKLYFAKDEREQGHCLLKQAMELGAANKYHMFWDIHIPTLVEMSLLGMHYGYCAGYAEELLGKFLGNMTVKYLRQRVKSIDESRIASFVHDFIRMYKPDKSPRLYFVEASLLGKPEIAINGITIPDTEWKTKKVKGLLEYLLLCSGSIVSKEVLAEVLWPETDIKSSYASLRTALYYLRKILSHYHAEVTGENAFITETPEGLQISKNSELELDVHRFLSLYGEFSGIAGQNPELEQKQAELLERMTGLYKGDLMEGSDYGDYVFQERERLRSVFAEAVQKLGPLLVKRREFRKAEEILRRVLTVDSYNEDICLQLIRLYIAEGRRSKAVKLYYSFKNLLEKELGISVDKRLAEAVKSS